jgi:uncharacterized protein YecT (DUF1311 family)
MWNAVVILGLVVATHGPRDAKTPARDDCRNASTQLDLNQCAGGKLVQERKRMNSALAKVIGERNERERAAVRAAQKAWQAYAAAQVEALYPGCSASYACGSVNTMCEAVALSALIPSRTSELRGMLREHQLEGDVCAPQSAYE